jgi:hypothetical protein
MTVDKSQLQKDQKQQDEDSSGNRNQTKSNRAARTVLAVITRRTRVVLREQ